MWKENSEVLERLTPGKFGVEQCDTCTTKSQSAFVYLALYNLIWHDLLICFGGCQTPLWHHTNHENSIVCIRQRRLVGEGFGQLVALFNTRMWFMLAMLNQGLVLDSIHISQSSIIINLMIVLALQVAVERMHRQIQSLISYQKVHITFIIPFSMVSGESLFIHIV